MGAPVNPTEHDVTEAVARAQEVIDGVINDEETWFERMMNLASRGARHVDDGSKIEEDRYAIFVMMQELVKSRALVLASRAEARLNPNISPTLRAAVDEYENGETL